MNDNDIILTQMYQKLIEKSNRKKDQMILSNLLSNKFNDLNNIFNKVNFKKPLVLSNINNNTVFKYKVLYDYDYNSVYWNMGMGNDASYEEEYYRYIEKNIYNIDKEISDVVGYKFNTDHMIFSGIKIDKEKELYLSSNSNDLYNRLYELLDTDSKYFNLKIVYGHKLITKKQEKLYKARLYKIYYYDNKNYCRLFSNFVNYIMNNSITISLECAYEIMKNNKHLSIDYNSIRFINNKMIYYISDNIYVVTDGKDLYISLDTNDKKDTKIDLPKFKHKKVKFKNKFTYPKNKK